MVRGLGGTPANLEKLPIEATPDSAEYPQ